MSTPNTAVAKRNEQLVAVRGLLDKITPQIAAALPKHMTPERMARIAFSAMQRQPLLLECTPQSLALCVITASELGLEPNMIGHAYLVPYRNNKTGKTDAQLILGYKGLIDLARRSGALSTISVACVHERDKFEYELGLEPRLKHRPYMDGERGNVTLVYAVARLKDGGYQFEVMSRAEIEQVRKKSKAGSSGPWVEHWDEMAKKTVLRRLCKLLPSSIELARAVAMDEATDAGVAAHTDIVAGFVDTEPDAVDAEIVSKPTASQKARERLGIAEPQEAASAPDAGLEAMEESE